MFWGLRVGREPTRDYSLTLLLSELQNTDVLEPLAKVSYLLFSVIPAKAGIQ